VQNIHTSFRGYARYRTPVIVGDDTGWPSRGKFVCIGFEDPQSPNYPHAVLLELTEDQAITVAAQLLETVRTNRRRKRNA
jgi:hypothetical protein